MTDQIIKRLEECIEYCTNEEKEKEKMNLRELIKFICQYMPLFEEQFEYEKLIKIAICINEIASIIHSLFINMYKYLRKLSLLIQEIIFLVFLQIFVLMDKQKR